MSSGQAKVAEDMDDWHYIKEQAGILDVKWDTYSNQANHAETGYKKHKYTGKRLKLYVKHCMEQDLLTYNQRVEVEELAQFEKLEKKFA